MNRFSSKTRMMFCSMALALTGLAAGCGGGGGGAAGGGAGEPFATTNNSTAAGAVNLGTAASFAILAKTTVTTTGTTAIVGHVGVSPAAETFLTGFSQARDATNQFSRSHLVTGWLFAADMAPPTPTQMTTAIGDMETAYTNAAGRAGGPDLGTEIGGQTIGPGTYTFTTNVTVNSDVTLNGSATDVWIFQLPGQLTLGSGARVTLAGGALPKNIFWQTAGATTIGTTAHFEGIILSQTAISMLTGATINGRLLAQSAVTLDANAVTQP